MMTERQRRSCEQDMISEFRIVFFSWRVLIILTVFSALFAWLASVLINPSAGYIVVIGMIGHYMVDEPCHFCCDVHDNWFVVVTLASAGSHVESGSLLFSYPIA